MTEDDGLFLRINKTTTHQPVTRFKWNVHIGFICLPYAINPARAGHFLGTLRYDLRGCHHVLLHPALLRLDLLIENKFHSH